MPFVTFRGAVERYRRLSLHARFALPVAVSITLLFAVLIPSVVYVQTHAALEQAKERGFQLTKVFAHSSVQAVVADDFLILRHIVDSVASERDVRYAMILDPTGRLLVHNDMRKVGHTYADLASVAAASADRPLFQEVWDAGVHVYDFAVPIYVMNDRRAVARIGISPEQELNAIRRTRNLVLSLGVVTLVVGLGFAAWQARSVARPVGDLVRGVREISRGNLAHRIALAGGDEIGHLAVAFNQMTESIQALIETSRDLGTSLDPDTVLRSIARYALDLVKADVVSIAPFDRTTEEARVKMVLGARANRIHTIVVTPGRGLGGTVLTTGETAITTNYLEDTRLIHDPQHDEAIREEGIVAALAVPITVKGDIVGLLWVANRSGRAFASADVDALQRMAQQVAIAMENARLYTETKLKTARLEALLRVSQTMTATLDEGGIVRVVVQTMTDLMDGIVVRLWAVAQAGTFRLLASGQLGASDGHGGQRLSQGEGLVGAVALERGPLVVEDMQADPRVVHRELVEREGLVSFLGLPLLRDERLLGVLCIATRVRHRFTDDEINLFTMFAQQAAIALENARLYQELKRSNDELLAAEEELVRRTRMAAMGEIAAVVAHEARNPLGALSNCVHLLRRNPQLTGEDAELLSIMETESQRLNGIVSDFLAFGRPRPPQFEEVDLHEVIYETFALLRRDDRCPDSIAFQAKFDLQAPTILGDRDQLRQVFWNLFLNAVQAMGHPGGELRVETRRGDAHVETVVQDTAPGIPAAVLPRIFEPFYTTKRGGSGLGLAIVRRIVEDHGGRITVDSEEGVGTRFSLRLAVDPRIR